MLKDTKVRQELYKVLSRDHRGNLFSFLLNEIKYGNERDAASPEGFQEVTPKQGSGPLCCFLDLPKAIEFVTTRDSFGRYRHVGHFQIWTVEATLSEESSVWLPGIPLRKLEHLPSGTILVDRLRLSRKVKDLVNL